MTHVSHIIPHTDLEEDHMRNNAKSACLRLPARDLALIGMIRPRKDTSDPKGSGAREARALDSIGRSLDPLRLSGVSQSG